MYSFCPSTIRDGAGPCIDSISHPPSHLESSFVMRAKLGDQFEKFVAGYAGHKQSFICVQLVQDGFPQNQINVPT